MPGRTDAGVSPQTRSLPAGARGTTNRSTDDRGTAHRGAARQGSGAAKLPERVPPGTKGLWLYTGDDRIGLYKDSGDWVARSVFTHPLATNGFVPIADAVRAHCTKTGSRIPRLGIVAHGDHDGSVDISNLKANIPNYPECRGKHEYEFLSPYTVTYFLETIARLDPCLTPDAQVILFSCLAGAGPEGNYLLERISRCLQGRTVIAFTTKGESGVGCGIPPAPPQPAGGLYETGVGKPEGPGGGVAKCDTPRRIDSPYAKHAKDGHIVRPATKPIGEKPLKPGQKETWVPITTIWHDRDFFTLLRPDPHLYTLGLMVIGWSQLEEKRGRTQKAVADDFAEAMAIIEKDKGYQQRRNAGLPKDEARADGVHFHHEAHVGSPRTLKLGERRKTYLAYRATFRPAFRTDPAVLWRNHSTDRELLHAYLDFMVALAARKRPDRKVVQRLTTKVGSREELAKIFDLSKVR